MDVIVDSAGILKSMKNLHRAVSFIKGDNNLIPIVENIYAEVRRLEMYLSITDKNEWKYWIAN